MTVEDYGDGIQAPDSPDDEADALDGPLESGMGMPIIRAIVDELAVEPGSNGRGTVVRMVKYLTSPRVGISRRTRRAPRRDLVQQGGRGRAS